MHPIPPIVVTDSVKCMPIGRVVGNNSSLDSLCAKCIVGLLMYRLVLTMANL